MARQIIEPARLLAIINDHLASLDACQNLHITSIIPDPHRTHGANWATRGWHHSGADHDEYACREEILAFMRNLQAHYDI